jgi:hypothetical protein
MKRRGVLGFLGGAAVAGPSMAQQAIASGLEGLQIGTFSGLEKGIGGAAYASGLASSGPFEDANYDPAGWAKRDLAEFLGRSAADLARERLDTGVDRLDPDLACMQSIALQAKLRIQRDRNFERNRAQHRNWLEREIQNVMKRLAS